MSPKPQKMKSYEYFSAWMDDQSKKNQDLIKALQSLIEQTAPNLTTTVKWGQGCWVDGDKPKVFIHTEEDHVQLGFYTGSSLNDPSGLLSGNGKYVRFIKVYDQGEIKVDMYRDLVRQAVTR